MQVLHCCGTVVDSHLMERGTLPMEAWEYQAGDCFRGGLVA
jgi:hypothetical protein